MELENLVNKPKNFLKFVDNMDQKDNITWGLKYIEFTNNKITNLEIENIDNFNKLSESPHTIKSIELSDNGVKTERVYTHSALMSFYDSLTGYYYIIGSDSVIYFLVVPPHVSIGKKKSTKKQKPINLFKMKCYQITRNEYNGISLSNVSYILFKINLI